jgi:hypothetical protein
VYIYSSARHTYLGILSAKGKVDEDLEVSPSASLEQAPQVRVGVAVHGASSREELMESVVAGERRRKRPSTAGTPR